MRRGHCINTTNGKRCQKMALYFGKWAGGGVCLDHAIKHAQEWGVSDFHGEDRIRFETALQSKKYNVSYAAQVQFDRLSDSEKSELQSIFNNSDTITVAPSGNFVSPLGTTKRIVWTMNEVTPIILSIVQTSDSE